MTSEETFALPVLGNDINQCMMCKHLKEIGEPFNEGSKGWRCTAFPGRDIPENIVMGFTDHREPWTGIDGFPDNGTKFEQVDGLPYTYEDLAGPLADDEDDAEDEEDPDDDE